jgi:hypothetical protein
MSAILKKKFKYLVITLLSLGGPGALGVLLGPLCDAPPELLLALNIFPLELLLPAIVFVIGLFPTLLLQNK